MCALKLKEFFTIFTVKSENYKSNRKENCMFKFHSCFFASFIGRKAIQPASITFDHLCWWVRAKCAVNFRTGANLRHHTWLMMMVWKTKSRWAYEREREMFALFGWCKKIYWMREENNGKRSGAEPKTFLHPPVVLVVVKSRWFSLRISCIWSFCHVSRDIVYHSPWSSCWI